MGMYLDRMANVVTIFNPEMIIVGVAFRIGSIYSHPMRRDEIIKRAFPVRPNVVRS